MEIHSLKQGWEIFSLMETKQVFQVPFCRPTIRLHLSLIFSFHAALHVTLWSCIAYRLLCLGLPASCLQNPASTQHKLRVPAPAHCLGFCHCTRILPHPTTSSLIPPPNTPTLLCPSQYLGFPKDCPQHLLNIDQSLHKTHRMGLEDHLHK